MSVFPDDKVLQSACELLDKKTAIQQIDKLLVYADGDVLYPNYNLLAAATGRFRVAQPELQNLIANKNYNLREIVLGDTNVFSIDFASQEPRFSAYTVGEMKSIEDFIVGKNQHDELAKTLKIERKQAKSIGLGLFYGMGHETLAKKLQVSEGEAIRIRDTFKQKYAKTFQFIEEMTYKDEIKTPLLGRRVRFSEGMRSTKKFN
jgi:DNA polymerase I-like protein with 3'-5' exonuclease and polymerase domains